MSLLEGTIQGIVHSALSGAGLMLDISVTKRSNSGYVPGVGGSVTEVTTAVSKAAFPDDSRARYMTQTNLGSDESILVIAQKPIRDASLTIEKGDHVTVVRATGSDKYEVMETVQDPAQALYECRVKGTAS